MGPKLDPAGLSATSDCALKLTNYESGSEITITKVRRGHEEESLMSLFPSGFITFQGHKVPLADKAASIKSEGGLFRVSSPFGGASRAIEQNV